MFGAVWVGDHGVCRYLMIGQQVQGGSVLDGSGIPTVVPDSSYVVGWLAAGTQCPDGSFVMIGLGSGAGAVALLTCFPEIDLTVIEIDPVVVGMCQRHFPLIDQLQDTGRLRIVVADANKYLSDSLREGDQWDVGLGDAYTGQNSLAINDPCRSALVKVTGDQWFNFIGTKDGPPIRHLHESMERLGKPITHVFDCSPDAGPAVLRNLMVTSATLDLPAIDEFEAFEGLDDESVDRVRARYRSMIGSDVTKV
jgi:hypothetical protein